MGLLAMMVIFLINIALMAALYYYTIGSVKYTVLTVAIMAVASFFLVAVSSYIVGLVGSSNQPVSGITISALLATAAFFLVLGFTGKSAILATLGVAAVVCCASCTSGDCSQDLKTGYLVGASPRSQQWAQVLGVLIPAFVIAPVLTLLHKSYVIGEGLKAPQATLFASITDALFQGGQLPYDMLGLGFALGVVVIVLDEVWLRPRRGFRLHLMPMAVGIYLPITLAVPMLAGGIIRFLTRKSEDPEDEGRNPGILIGSGLIAGEAIMGVALAVFVYFNIDLSAGGMAVPGLMGHGVSEILSLLGLVGIGAYLYKKA